MARYIHRQVLTDQDELDNGVPLDSFAAVDYARTELAAADPSRARLFIILTVPADATHAIAIAFGPKPAQLNRQAFVIEPGGSFDTSELSADRQPTERITAWTYNVFCRQGDCVNAEATINCRVMEAFPDCPTR